MLNQQKVLREPFNIDTHKKTFIQYLEVIILPSGEIVYAVPSHQEKLISLACEMLNMTRVELNNYCPKEYYYDFMNWLCMITKCVSVWNDHTLGEPNEKQMESLVMLREAELYRGVLAESGR